MELPINISNTYRNPIKMPVWDRHPGRRHLLIFVLYHTTTEEIHNTQKTIQDALPSIMGKETTDWENDNKYNRPKPWGTEIPQMTVELVPYDRHCLRTRRELLAFWKQYHPWHTDFEGTSSGAALLHLSEPLSDVNSAQIPRSRLQRDYRLHGIV